MSSARSSAIEVPPINYFSEYDKSALNQIVNKYNADHTGEVLDLSNPNLYNGYSEGIYANQGLPQGVFDMWYSGDDSEEEYTGPKVDNGNLFDVFSGIKL